MEQLALFSIPRGHNEVEEAESGDVAAGSSPNVSQISEFSIEVDSKTTAGRGTAYTTTKFTRYLVSIFKLSDIQREFKYWVDNEVVDRAFALVEMAQALPPSRRYIELRGMLLLLAGDPTHARTEIMEALLLNGDTHFPWYSDLPLLHTAVENGSDDMVRLLAGRVPNINAGDDDGWTPLHVAALNGADSHALLLLERGADIQARDAGGWTPLHIAASYGMGSHARLLLDNGADILTQNLEGLTALHLAAGCSHNETVTVLLERGADIEAKSSSGLTALYLAAIAGFLTTVELLLSQGADPNAVDDEGWPVLHASILSQHQQVVHSLCYHGADWNSIGEHQLAPIVVTGAVHNREILSTLLYFGATFGAWKDTVKEIPESSGRLAEKANGSVLLALDNLVSMFREIGQFPEADEVQSVIIQLEGGLHSGVEYPLMSGRYGYRKRKFTARRGQEYWKGLEEQQMQLIEERKEEYGEEDERYLGCLDMLGALYQDWIDLGHNPWFQASRSDAATHAASEASKPIVSKMTDLALLLYSNGRKNRAINIMKDVLRSSANPISNVGSTVAKPNSTDPARDTTPLALFSIAVAFERQGMKTQAEIARLEAEKLIKEALENQLQAKGCRTTSHLSLEGVVEVADGLEGSTRLGKAV
ncbi:MAG: hypothetical protein LQ340_004231 [Diploschistes diacapsis]|nr:MAG: hypothetical protein LQ340_004231 [Diploschistes diacapsis]